MPTAAVRHAVPSAVPTRDAVTPAERRLIDRLRTPDAVQAYLNALPYNTEPVRATLRSFRGVIRHHNAHCLEAALFAAVVLEQHGYRATVLSFESIDLLDHVIFVYQRKGRWGSIARSRDPGLHGRKPVFATARALALSYVDPYVDDTGRVKGYAVVDLAKEMGAYDWRFSERNVWAVERMLIDYPHRPIKTSDARYRRLRAWYKAYRDRHGRKPVEYRGRERWSALPPEFVRRSPRPR
jgi:hypothetical protein